jgi:outer membrane protein
MSKNILVAALIAAGVLSAGVAQAEDGPFMVRARAVNVAFDNGQTDLVSTLNIRAEDRWIPEVDLSYFITKNIAAELVLTYPQTVDITLGGAKIGKIKALPPSLMAQYHFTDFGAFKPYVGAGVNFTIFTSRDNILNGAAKVDGNSLGLAAQVGFDYMFTKNWGLNLDVKYIQMSTDVTLNGTKIGKLDLNPITAGVGVTYRY